jgi:hypothetical protein
MSRSPMTGEWLRKSSDSDSSSIICVTSAYESPIWRPKPEECRKPNRWQKGGWSSPTSTSSCRTSVFYQDLKPEEGEITEGIVNSGAVWIPFRWGHLV